MSTKLDLKLDNANKKITDITMLVVDGVNKGKKYRIGGKKVKVGRAKDNDIVLLNPKISKSHATLELKDGKIYLEDLGSSNGTFVNGNKVPSAILSPGDKIGFGSACEVVISGTFDGSTAESDIVGQAEGLTGILSELKDVDVEKTSAVGMSDLDYTAKHYGKKKNRKLLPLVIIVMVMLIGALYFVGGNQQSQMVPNAMTGEASLLSKVPTVSPLMRNDVTGKLDFAPVFDDLMSPTVRSEADQLFKKAYNTYLSNRFNDAIKQFQEVLLFDKNHELAKIYIIRAEADLNELIDVHDKNAQALFNSLRYQQAIVEFRNVVNLLGSNTGDPRYAEAKKNIKLAQQKLKRY